MHIAGIEHESHFEKRRIDKTTQVYTEVRALVRCTQENWEKK